MKNCLPFVFLLSTYHMALCQSLYKAWDYRYGGNEAEYLSRVAKTDNGFILIGSTPSGIGGDKTQPNWDATGQTSDFWIVEIDTNGNKLWDRRYGNTGQDYPRRIIAVTGGYVIVGVSTSSMGGDKSQPAVGSFDFWLLAIDSIGNKLWDRTYGGTGDELSFGFARAVDGGYLLGGTSYSGIGGDKTQANWGYTDFWVVKVDSLGNKQWDRRYGGTDYDFLRGTVSTPDGGFILAGHSRSSIGGDRTQVRKTADYDYWVIKIDSLGNKIWDAAYGGGQGSSLFDMADVGDGYMLAGKSYGAGGDRTGPDYGGTDYWIAKIDSLGNKIWDESFGGSDNDDLQTVTATGDGGVLLTGQSQSPMGGTKSEANMGIIQTWVVRTDSLGHKLWDKTVLGNKGIVPANAIDLGNGCYLVGNSTWSDAGGDKSQPSWNSSNDYWIVKYCEHAVGIIEVNDQVILEVYPNPSAGEVSILLQRLNLKEARFILTNNIGQVLYDRNETNLADSYTKMLDLSNLPGGSYFVTIQTNAERITKQVVKE